LSILLAACGHPDSEAPLAHHAAAAPSYHILQLEPHAVSGSVRLPGVLLPFESVQIFPKVNGFVKEVLVDRGSVVREGAVLLRLEAPEMEDRLASARLKYVEAHSNYLSAKDKYDRMVIISRTPGTISAYDMEAARDQMIADSALAQGEMQEEKAQQDLYGYLTVTAPFDGVITERNVHPGALVGPGAQGARPMLVLQETGKLRLVVSIPEQYTKQFGKAGVLDYSVNAIPGSVFKGRIARSAGALDDNYRAETIEVDVPNAGGNFKPGMYAEVRLPVDGDANAFVVPKSAIVTSTERKYVVVEHDGKALWIDVSLGNDLGDSTEVFGNLHTGDHVLASADYTIKEGSDISVNQ